MSRTKPLSLRDVIEEPVPGFWGADSRHGVLTPCRVVRNGDVGKDGVIIGSSLPVRWFAERELTRARILTTDSILVSSGAYTGNVGRVISAGDGLPIVASNFVRRLRAKPTMSSEWLFHLLRSSQVQKHVWAHTAGTAIPNLSTSFYWSVPIPYLPSHPDQRRIAAILDTAEEAIRQTKAVIEKLKKIKQGLLHDLLTRGIGKDGKLRPSPDHAPNLYKESPLGKIPKEWEIVKISSCSETFAGGTPSRGRLDYYGGSIPWVKSAEVNLDEIISTEETLTEKGHRFSSARWIEPNTALIAMYGATAGQVSWLTIRATANQAVLALPARESQTDPRWLYWAAKNAMPRIMASVQGSGQPNLSKGVIDKSIISRPLLTEQKAARDYLDEVLVRIRAEACIASKFRMLKQGLMEDLLTGRVRVTDLPKDIEKMLDEIAGRN